jgi:hypothetical protein
MKTKYTLTLPKGYKRIKLPDYKKWITALESGKFRQERSSLTVRKNKHVSYCCLGVLCKVQGRLVLNQQGYHNDGSIDNSTVSLSPHNPCAEVLETAGVFPDGVYVTSSNNMMRRSLADCNDYGNLNFVEIASIIKKIWKA